MITDKFSDKEIFSSMSVSQLEECLYLFEIALTCSCAMGEMIDKIIEKIELINKKLEVWNV